MESSTVVLFRAFVMLAFLIIVPLAAIFGSAFPQVVKSAIIDRFVASTDPSKPTSGADAQGGLTNAWQTQGSTAAAAETATPWSSSPPATAQGTTVAAGWSADPARPGSTTPAPASADVLASFSSPADDRSSHWPSPPATGGGYPATATLAPWSPAPVRGGASAQAPGGVAGAGMLGSVAPSTGTAPSSSRPATALTAPNTPGGAAGTSGSAAGADPFTAMQRALRQYGATYYLLETWGSEGELYRFHVKMAIAGNPNYTRHFEATDRDALSSMRRVVAQVEAWRAGRLDP